MESTEIFHWVPYGMNLVKDKDALEKHAESPRGTIREPPPTGGY